VSDRVPIGTIPGAVLPWVGVDLALASFGRAATISRLFLVRRGQAGGDVVSGSLRDATGGGGSGIAWSFAPGAATAVATGALAISAAESVYLRITAADANSQDLRGWFEVTGAAGVTTALTSLVRVKAWRGIVTSAQDALLEEVIAGVSARMQSFLHRRIVAEDLIAELYDGPRGDTLTLRAFPVQDPGALVVREGGVVVASSEYVVRAPAGQIVRVSNGEAGSWERGRLNVSVDYQAGYDEVPEDLALAATRQAAYVSLETPAGNAGRLGNRGTALETGGSSEYVTTEWLPGVLATLEGYRDRRLA